MSHGFGEWDDEMDRILHDRRQRRYGFIRDADHNGFDGDTLDRLAVFIDYADRADREGNLDLADEIDAGMALVLEDAFGFRRRHPSWDWDGWNDEEWDPVEFLRHEVETHEAKQRAAAIEAQRQAIIDAANAEQRARDEQEAKYVALGIPPLSEWDEE